MTQSPSKPHSEKDLLLGGGVGEVLCAVLMGVVGRLAGALPMQLVLVELVGRIVPQVVGRRELVGHC